MRWAAPLFIATLCALGSALAQPSAAHVQVTGVIVLPDGPALGVVKIEAREGAAPQGPLIGELHVGVARERAIPFAFRIDPARLRQRGQYRVRAAWILQDEVVAVGGPARLQPRGARIDLGQITLTPIERGE